MDNGSFREVNFDNKITASEAFDSVATDLTNLLLKLVDMDEATVSSIIATIMCTYCLDNRDLDVDSFYAKTTALIVESRKYLK